MTMGLPTDKDGYDLRFRDKPQTSQQRFMAEVRLAIRTDAEELRTWRNCYPQRAAEIREIAKAKVESRPPEHDPPSAYR